MSSVEHFRTTKVQRKSVISRHVASLDRYKTERDPRRVKLTLDKLGTAFDELEAAHHQHIDGLASEADAVNKVNREIDWYKETYKAYKEQIDAAYEWLDENGVNISLSNVSLVEPGTAPSQPSSEEASASLPAAIAARLSLPPQDVPKFSGKDPREYHAFIKIFDQVIGVPIKDPQEKLIRLSRYLEGEALTAIRACILKGGEAGYTQALNVLRDRYGDLYIVSRKMIDDLKHGGAAVKPTDLRRLSDDVSIADQVLHGHEMYGEINTHTFIQAVLERCHSYVKTKWRKLALKSWKDNQKYPDYKEFMKFLKDMADEACNPVYGYDSYKTSGRAGVVHNVQAGPDTSTTRRRKCVVCDQDHYVTQCEKFRNLQPRQRFEVARKHRLCFGCLRGTHSVRECRSCVPCPVQGCGRRHSQMIHMNDSSGASRGSSARTDGGGPGEGHSGQSHTVHAVTGEDCVTCLPLITVLVNGIKPVVALLDPGATCTLISADLARELNLRGKKVPCTLETVNGVKTSPSMLVSFKVGATDGSYVHDIKHACIVPGIPARAPAAMLNLSEHAHLADLPLGRVRPGSGADIIVGQDNADLLMPLDVRRSTTQAGLPYAVLTRLGWVLNGSLGTREEQEQVFATCNYVTHEIIEEKLESLWNVEHDKEPGEQWSQDDHTVYDLWEEKACFQDGRYVVPIPWKKGHPEFPNNRYLAQKRLDSTLRKLERTGMYQRYDDGIQKYLDDGHAELVPDSALARNDGAVWYLPHHGVYQAEKDKLRIVHDCSAKHQGVSLNTEVHRGPVLTNKLTSVLLKFRRYAVAWTADITAMYLQVVIPEDERDCLRFLWKREGRVIEIRMTRHLFGGIWCSSSSSYSVLRTLREFGANMTVKKVIEKAMYVDDLLHSVEATAELRTLMPAVCQTLVKGGFPLGKHMVNDPELLRSIPEEDRAKEAKVVAEDMRCKALGIRWEVGSDSLSYTRTAKEESVLTKREMLSKVAAMYDPLGLIIPIVILGRMLFQQAVRLRLNWDDAVPDDLSRRWSLWWTSLESLGSLKFPRVLVPTNLIGATAELHHFCDGSTQAYGVCSYLRLTQGDRIHVQLVSAKSRLVPIKPMTIPRVELCAAKMAADADAALKLELDLVLEPSSYWSDSKVALCYIKSEPGRFKPFVAHRVAAIQEKSAPDRWEYVPTGINVADLLTRGCLPRDLPETWNSGPEFLRLPRNRWTEHVPVSQVPSLDEGDQEIRKAAIHHVQGATSTSDPLEILLHYYSDFERLRRAVAWLLRIKSTLLKRSCCNGELKISEIKDAETLLVTYVQSREYPSEIAALSTGGSPGRRSSLYTLNPQLVDGAVVVGGRLGRSSTSARHPVILPGKSRLSRLILDHAHNKVHLGVEWTLSVIRQRYWIPGARNVLRKIRGTCVTCQRLYGRARTQKMAELPADRVSVKSTPWEDVGVDLFGPFYVSHGRRREKRWGCVFTCLAIRAIHLEVLATMDSDSFLNAFRRFCARRGTPTRVRSDQGTNFVGALAELRAEFQEINKLQVVLTARNMGVEWIFNPPHASHHGGVWERMIRTVRKVLVAIMPSASVSEEVLTTAFVETEGLVNGRPLTKCSSDGCDDTPLTPNHFLVMKYNAPPPWREFGAGEALRKRWKLTQNLAYEFWKRWTKEYLPELQARRKWNDDQPNYKTGELVLLVEEQQKSARGRWPLARIEEVKVSEDGRVRSVKLRYNGTMLTRPITKVAPLELSVSPTSLGVGV